MASGVNKVILVGNLGQDPTIRALEGGTKVATFTLATTESYVDREKNRQERTEWHRIVVWAKQAEIAGEYLRKGKQVYVEGSLQTREWTDRDGNKRYTTEVRAQRFQMLGSRGDAPREVPEEPQTTAAEPESGYDEDDIPF